MPKSLKDVDTLTVNRILNDSIIFQNQEVSHEDKEKLGYDAIALKPEEKESLRLLLTEIETLYFKVIDEVSARSDIKSFFEALLGHDAVLFFNKYQEAFGESFVKNIDECFPRSNCIYYGRGDIKILYTDTNKILEVPVVYVKTTLNDVIEKLNKLKSYYAECLNKIKNFSVQEILNAKGYNSLEEL